MSWMDLLQNDVGEHHSVPWLGGKFIQLGSRRWGIDGRLPHEHGWYSFQMRGRRATLVGKCDGSALGHRKTGYLVGNRMMPDDGGAGERVHLIEAGLDRFARISAGRPHEDGPLVYQSQEMPLGPEEEVLNYFLDGHSEVKGYFSGALPGLYAALRLEIFQRVEAEKRRAELEHIRREEEERRAREQHRRELVEKLGDGASRREMAKIDFREAAKAALAVGGAELLDVRDGQRGEKVVRYRLDGARYECVCDARTMRIVDAGICLNAHGDDGYFEAGTKGDTWFTLESLPNVVREADREGVLVVFRRV